MFPHVVHRHATGQTPQTPEIDCMRLHLHQRVVGLRVDQEGFQDGFTGLLFISGLFGFLGFIHP